MLPKISSKANSNNINKIVPVLDYLMRFDGCSKGNPGIAGCGAVIYHNSQEIWSGTFYVGINATNNHAEYAGLILGLQKALELNIESLDVEGDSLLVIQQMNKIYNQMGETQNANNFIVKSLNIPDNHSNISSSDYNLGLLHLC